VGHDWGGGIAWQFAMDHPEMTRRLVVMNCPHLAIFQRELRNDRRQLAKSWYMFFFQIPWLPETLLGLNHAWPIGNAIRQSAAQKGAITDDDLRVLREAGLVTAESRGRLHLYRLDEGGADEIRRYLGRVWGDALGRFRLLAENTTPEAGSRS